MAGFGLDLGTLSSPKLSLPFAGLGLGESAAGQDPDGALAAPGTAQALFSPCPKGERGISLMQNKESCPSAFPGMHFFLKQ